MFPLQAGATVLQVAPLLDYPGLASPIPPNWQAGAHSLQVANVSDSWESDSESQWQAGTCGSQVVHFIFSCLCKLGLSRSKLFQISSYPPTSPFDVYSLLTLYPSLLALPEVWIHRV